jgi:glutamate-1-semialdehyde 2,1-aminomutase
MAGMGAFVATVKYLKREPVIEHLWRYGQQLIDLLNGAAREFGVEASLSAAGVPCSPHYTTLDRAGNPSLELRTLFAQEMVRHGVLMPWIALSYRHGQEELDLTARALRATLEVYRKALDQGAQAFLQGPAIKPVFRRYN